MSRGWKVQDPTRASESELARDRSIGQASTVTIPTLEVIIHVAVMGIPNARPERRL